MVWSLLFNIHKKELIELYKIFLSPDNIEKNSV